jgi:hypothetical protein
LSQVLYDACKELIDDVKGRSVDLVFKDLCLDILARAKQVLTDAQFKRLARYATELMQEKAIISIDTIN